MSTASFNTCPEVASIMGVVDTHIRWSEKNKRKERKYFRYHPSEFGGCLRRQQYLHYNQLGFIEVEPQDVSSQMLRLWGKGHNMHSRWVSYFQDIGALRGYWQCANPLCLFKDDSGKPDSSLSLEQKKEIAKSGKSRIHGRNEVFGIFKPDRCQCGCYTFNYHEISVHSEELNFAGHIDMILDFSKFDENIYDIRKTFNSDLLPKEPVVVDMKTAGEWQFKNQVKKYGAHEKYIVQLNIYLHLLNLNTYGILIYENKSDSDLAIFKVAKNDKLIKKICWQAEAMQAMKEDRLLPPPKPETKDDYECGKCEFSNICHKSLIWEDDLLHVKRQKFYDINSVSNK